MLQNVQKFRVTGINVLHNFQKFRVLWHGSTELTGVPGAYERCCTRTPGIVARCTELAEVPDTGMNVPQNQQKFGYGYESPTEHPEVPGIVARAYRTYGSSGYGYECPTELTEVPGTGDTRVNARPLGGEFDLKWRI